MIETPSEYIQHDGKMMAEPPKRMSFNIFLSSTYLNLMGIFKWETHLRIWCLT